jgi:hypothetical protein
MIKTLSDKIRITFLQITPVKIFVYGMREALSVDMGRQQLLVASCTQPRAGHVARFIDIRSYFKNYSEDLRGRGKLEDL